MKPKSITLWSWLIKSETKKEFFCPPGLEVTNEQLAAELETQIAANRLPAEVQLCIVNWDDTGTKQTRVAVRYTGPDSSADVLRFLVGIDQMGSFAYVEEKSLLRPPIFPPTPEKPKPNKWAIAGERAGCLGWIFFIPFFFSSRDDIKRYDERVAETAKRRNEAWETWQEQILKVAYLSRTDDVLGRFTMSLSSTLDVVVKRLFVDQEAELRRQSETQQTQEEIEKELKKRREEAFK